MTVQQMIHQDIVRGYARRYARATYRPPEPPHQPETVWTDLGSTFRERRERKARATATGGGPRAVWFNQARGSGSLERMIFG